MARQLGSFRVTVVCCWLGSLIEPEVAQVATEKVFV